MVLVKKKSHLFSFQLNVDKVLKVKKPQPPNSKNGIQIVLSVWFYMQKELTEG